MKNTIKSAGFTLVELMICIVIVLILASVVFGKGACGACTGIPDEQRRRANEDAKQYIRELHPSWQNIRTVCQSTDSDGDGYVSCTIAADNNGAEITDGIECRATWMYDYARGCRPMRVIVNSRRY